MPSEFLVTITSDQNRIAQIQKQMYEAVGYYRLN